MQVPAVRGARSAGLHPRRHGCAVLAALLLALAAAGCASSRAKAAPQPPTLDVPAPPPRVIVPLEPESTAPPTPTPDPEQPSQQKPPRRPAPRAENKADPTRAAKTEPPPPAVETVRPVTPPPTVTLQPELPANPAEMERRVREQLAQAKNDLNRVNYDKLNNDGRSQYDTAKRFMDQADQALKEKNLLFAVKVAEKAAGLAASLPVR